MTDRSARADAVRPLVQAEYDRLRGLGFSRESALKVVGRHLGFVSRNLRIPLQGESWGSVRHLISGHDGLRCTCKHLEDGSVGECSRTPEVYVLEAFETAVPDYPITEPEKLRAAKAAPRVRRNDPLAAMVASGLVTPPRGKTAFKPWRAPR